MIEKIYLDLDGVLCDFDLQFSKLNPENLAFKQYIEKYSKTKAWKLIHAAEHEFWATMPWLPEGKDLFHWIQNNFKKESIEILTAGATRYHGLVSGKTFWCRTELGDYKINIVRGVEKQNFATPKTSLIDDMARNIDQFREKGGIGILYIGFKDAIEKLIPLRNI